MFVQVFEQMWEYHNWNFDEIPDFEMSTMITKVATAIQSVCQSDMDPDVYRPIIKNIIKLAARQAVIDFDMDAVVDTFEASDFGSSYLIRILTPETEETRSGDE